MLYMYLKPPVFTDMDFKVTAVLQMQRKVGK